MAKYGIIQSITQIAEERGLSKETVKEIIKESLEIAARKKFKNMENFEVEISETSGNINMFMKKRVVEQLSNPNEEIALEEAKKINENIKVGDTIKIPLRLEEFGRNAILVAKQLMYQGVREKEKERMYEEYKGKVGEIITGSVQRIDKKGIVVNFNKAEGILPVREQIPGEKYKQGDTIRAYILEVSKPGKIILSRTHPNFLKKLFELEVPEIREGIIEIKTVARIPGVRAKIAVTSRDPRIDPVGSCVGVKGSRVQAVVKELNNEKIDVIQWSMDPLVFVSRALSSVKILREEINEKERWMRIVIPDDELPIAIGKSGQNTYLASHLTDFKIDIMSESEYKDKPVPLVKEFTNTIKKKLLDYGFRTLRDILQKGEAELLKVPGIGKQTAKKILEIAKQYE